MTHTRTHARTHAKHVDPVDHDDDARKCGTMLSTTFHFDAMPSRNREPLDDAHDDARWKTRGIVGAVYDGLDDSRGGARGGDV